MPHARGYPCKSGVFWYVIPDDRRGRPIPCGRGAKGKRLAVRAVNRVRELKYQREAGIEMPRECVWTLEDLHLADIQAAKDRGLRTARPQLQGKKSRRESHWRMLFTFFRPEMRLDEVRQQGLREYQAVRRKGSGTRTVGPRAINRDLDVLRAALALARDRSEESGYVDDPFRRLEPLEEKAGARRPIALSEAKLDELVRLSRALRPAFGAFIELLRLTASRLNECPVIEGRLLRYPAYKRGRPRAFRLEGRLALVGREKRAFNRRLWREVVETLGVPDLNPHDIRHSVLTAIGRRHDASLALVQAYGGWTSPGMAAIYLHPDDRALRGIQTRKRQQGRGNRSLRRNLRRAG